MRRDTTTGSRTIRAIISDGGFRRLSEAVTMFAFSQSGHRSHSLNLSALNRLWVMRNFDATLSCPLFLRSERNCTSQKCLGISASYLITVWL